MNARRSISVVMLCTLVDISRDVILTKTTEPD